MNCGGKLFGQKKKLISRGGICRHNNNIIIAL